MTTATPAVRAIPFADAMTAMRRIPLPVVAGIATTMVCVVAIGPWPAGVFQDDGLYVILARALAEGEGYRFLNLPGAPAATHYPPGYPAVLASLWKLYPSFPANVTLFKFANAIFLGTATGLACQYARTCLALGPRLSLAIAMLFTACVPLLLLSVMVLSEPLFLALLLATLLLAERAVRAPRHAQLVVAIVAAVALAHVRTLGVLTIPALGLVLAWQREWRASLATFMGGALGVLPWHLWSNAHAGDVPAVFSGKYGGYGDWLALALREEGPLFLLGVAARNLQMLWAYASEITATAGLALPFRVASGAALVLLATVGLWRLRERAPVTLVFLLGYGAVVLAWPFAPQRFLWGVWPLVGLTLYLGATAAASTRGAMLLRTTGALALLGYVAANARAWQADTINEVQRSVADRARPIAEWVQAHAPPNAVLATDDDALIYLYTGRRAIPNGTFTPQEHLVPQTPAYAADALGRILDTYRVDFVLASSEYGVYAAQGLMTARPPRLRLLMPLTSGAVFAPAGAP